MQIGITPSPFDKIALRSSNRLQGMDKKIRVRVALIISAVACYRVFTHVHQIATECIQIGQSKRCSFENAANFEGLQNLDLLFTCGWVSGAVLCWFFVAQASNKPR
jgi:hypothetical protein